MYWVFQSVPCSLPSEASGRNNTNPDTSRTQTAYPLPTLLLVWSPLTADASSGLAAITPRALGPDGRGPYGGVYSTDSLVRRTVRENHRLAVTYRHVLLVRRLCLVPLAPAVGLCPWSGLPPLSSRRASQSQPTTLSNATRARNHSHSTAPTAHAKNAARPPIKQPGDFGAKRRSKRTCLYVTANWWLSRTGRRILEAVGMLASKFWFLHG